MYQDPDSLLDDVNAQQAKIGALDTLGQSGALPEGQGLAGTLARNQAKKQAWQARRAARQTTAGLQADQAAPAQTAADQAQAPQNPALQNAITGGASAGQNFAPQDAASQLKAPDTSAWNTDGYAKPGFTAQPTGGPLAGWDAQKWADPNHQTPKYVAGRIMASHDPRSEEGRAGIISDLQKAYPGTTFNGKDKVDIPGLGQIDIFQGAGAGAYNPQWLDIAADAQAGGNYQANGTNALDNGFVSQNRMPDMSAINSRNTQTGGDALQAIYQMIPGLFNDLGVQAQMDPIKSRNTQTGGDALQAIYQLLPGLMGNM